MRLIASSLVIAVSAAAAAGASPVRPVSTYSIVARDATAGELGVAVQSEVRQVGMVDARGNVATFTGKLDIPAAGGQSGTGYVVQANLMEKATVGRRWPARSRPRSSW